MAGFNFLLLRDVLKEILAALSITICIQRSERRTAMGVNFRMGSADKVRKQVNKNLQCA